MLASVSAATAEGYAATLMDLGRPPVVGLVEPDRELARVEQSPDRRWGDEMPAFTLTRHASAPVEEVWKLLHDPARFPEWWAGVETVRPARPGSTRCGRTAIRTSRWRNG